MAVLNLFKKFAALGMTAGVASKTARSTGVVAAVLRGQARPFPPEPTGTLGRGREFSQIQTSSTFLSRTPAHPAWHRQWRNDV